MDGHMVRSRLGWHHHMTECILAHHYLVRVWKRLEKGAPALTVPQARLLVASVLPLKRLDAQEALKRSGSFKSKNRAAYLPDGKRTIKRSDGL